LDNVTHSLFAVTLGRTPIGRAGRGTTTALLIASNVPDIDILTTMQSAASYLQWHRGPTHGPLSVLVLGLPAAGLAWLWTRVQERRARKPLEPAASFPTLAAIAMMGVVFHLLMDFPTSYGTRLLSPFDWHWYSVDWMPIIDIYLLMALIAGLVTAGRSAESRRRSAAMVFAFMVVNYGVRGTLHHQAVALAPRVFGPFPEPCDPRPLPTVGPEWWPQPAADADANATGASPCLMGVAAMPTFLLPTTWRVIGRFSNGYEIHDLDLIDAALGSSAAQRVRLFFPNEWTLQTQMASETNLGQTYLGFARFPAARTSVDADGGATVRWSDMRFVGGPLRLDQRPQREPFSAVIRLDPGGRVIEERFGP
jgi:membrane-bound metal-dependent hydrolase YbcI (DUF457 family)